MSSDTGQWNLDKISVNKFWFLLRHEPQFVMLFSFLSQLELKLGLGGTSYEDFIRSVHLPMQLRYYLCSSL